MSDYESGYDPKLGYNRNAFAHKTPITAILGRTVKLIAAPIGLVSEAIHHNKEKKEASSSGMTASPTDDPAYVNVPPEQAEDLIKSGQAVPADGQEATHVIVPENEDDGVDRDEADWALDEAAEETEQQETSAQKTPLVKSSLAPPNGKPYRLPFPVVLPQRRPGVKARGFVRAYAPVLQESGIDQNMFLGFLKDFHTAAQASPIFSVVMVAAAIAGAYPDIIVAIAVQAVQIAARVGQEIQERYRLNKFLDQANKDIFIPKGLFAMVVTYRPGTKDEPAVGSKTVDLGATAFAKYGQDLVESEKTESLEEDKSKMKEMKEKMKQFRIASGETHGEAEMPVTCAPLLFPALDAASEEASGIMAKSKHSSKFMSDYFDRRAQAAYAIDNHNSTLTTSVSPIAPQFKSRYADPNDHTNMHLFTLLTGGRFKAEPLGARRRYEKAQRKAAEKRAQGIKENPSKRMLQENVLYLTIVNMPSEAELEGAKRTLAAEKAEKAEKK